MREEREMRENEAKGLDIWGRPLPPGKRIPKLNLKQRASDGQAKNSSYRSPRVRTSPRSSQANKLLRRTPVDHKHRQKPSYRKLTYRTILIIKVPNTMMKTMAKNSFSRTKETI